MTVTRTLSGGESMRASQETRGVGAAEVSPALQRWVGREKDSSPAGTAQGLEPGSSQNAFGTPGSRGLIRSKFRCARALGLTALICCATFAFAADLTLPATITAGNPVTFTAPGSGEATLYVSGPGTAIKRKVQLGQINISADELKNAGRYMVAVEGVGDGSFFVTASQVGSVAFLARPSRVPADTHDVISGTAFLFDQYQNLVTTPQPVKFDLSVNGQSISRTDMSKDGVAYVKLDSSKKEGPAQFVASSGAASVRRIVQEVASDPCNIHMNARQTKEGILVSTDPIHDCSGNPVPDGTIVTFTSTDANGRSTVDARIKLGTAQAILPASDSATISVASGVVVGNEIHWRGGM
jgi:hypothetical protein